MIVGFWLVFLIVWVMLVLVLDSVVRVDFGLLWCWCFMLRLCSYCLDVEVGVLVRWFCAGLCGLFVC